MNKKTIITLAIPIAMFTISNAKASLFTNALSNYCVPKTGEYCSNAFAAKYNEAKNICECKNSTYLKYNATERHCEINCPAGSVAIPVSACPNGSAAIFVANDS